MGVYFDCLVSSDISQDVIVSCHDSERIGAITITPVDWPARLSLGNLARICAINKGVPTNTYMSPEDIKEKLDYWCSVYSCIHDELDKENPLMKGPPMII